MELKGGTVQLVASRFDHEIHLPSRLRAEFRVVVAGLHAELLNRVDGRADGVGLVLVFLPLYPVDEKAVEIGPLPVHAKGHAGPAVSGQVARGRASRRRLHDAGDQEVQLGEIAAVQGEIHDFPVLHHCPHLAIVRLQ